MIGAPPKQILQKFGPHMSAMDPKAQEKNAQAYQDVVQHTDGRLVGMFSMWLSNASNANIDDSTTIDINADCELYSNFFLQSQMRKKRRGKKLNDTFIAPE